MGLGLMNKKAKLCERQKTIDSEGFRRANFKVLYEIRVFVEEKHGSERWANLAKFFEATDIFRFRVIPNFKVKTSHFILYNDQEYDILSVENVKGKSMYLEVLAKRVEPSSG